MNRLFLLLFCFPSLVMGHPFHVSVTNVDYNAGSKSIEITHKIFLNDLENALKEIGGEKVNLAEKKYEGLVSQYVQDHFSISINGEKALPIYVGMEVQDDAIWCYQEVNGIDSFSNITIENTILLASFEDQTNLVHVKKGEELKSLRLYQDAKTGAISF